MKTASVEHY